MGNILALAGSNTRSARLMSATTRCRGWSRWEAPGMKSNTGIIHAEVRNTARDGSTARLGRSDRIDTSSRSIGSITNAFEEETDTDRFTLATRLPW